MTRHTSSDELDRLNDIVKLPSVDELKSLGGYTHNLNHTTGYMVSLAGYEVVIPADICTNENWGMYYITHRSVGSVKKETYVGAWFNPDDDNFYFDVSQWVEDKEEALTLGEKNEQLAIYEIETGMCIPCLDVPTHLFLLRNTIS